MTLWKIVVVGLGLLTLRRMIKGFPSWDVPLPDGRVIRVLKARHDRHALIDRTNDPHQAHGERFNVTFDGDWMGPAERIAAMPEQQYRRLPDGGLELLNQGRLGQRIYPGKTDRSVSA